ncbi:MAG: alpha-glucosidase [Oscillospiraceae bacterium]|nr:alpha-glucosidase [Oscillospiraceae bacterium]
MEKKWWHDAVVYEIYCKSFCDSNGDGIGDLKGVMSKLPVLKELGINCIWFTPIYKSPQVDNGYDVADYRDIEPDYGTLDDFRQLLDMAHSMGIRVIMDQVLNHSSDECEWFRESRKSKDNPYRNYYIWQPPKADGSEPNNWGNYFREGNGSAWTFDEVTGEYYLHQYSAKMPDLNWEYEPLRQEIYSMLRWWLDMGVDGFRLDIFSRLKKPEGFPDTKKAPDILLDHNGFVVDQAMCTCVEGIHEILHALYVNVFGPYDCMTVGEGSGITAKNAPEYIGESRQEIATVYHFNLASRKRPAFTIEKFREVQSEWAGIMSHNCWSTQYLSNHDSARQVSHYGDDGEYRVPSAKLLATLIHTSPGTPFVYQGEELGMVNVQFDSIADYNCRYTVGDYHSMIRSGVSPQEALKVLGPKSRDNARTPYQWDSSENAGFSTGKPWIKVNPRYKDINLEADRKSPDSIFAYYQKLIAMRKVHPAMIDGDLQFLLPEHPQMIVYLRKCLRETLLVIANYSGETVKFQLPEAVTARKWKRLLSNREETVPSVARQDAWLPWEAEVYSLDI